MNQHNDDIKQTLAFMGSSLEEGASLIGITYDRATNEIGLDVQYPWQDYHPIEEKYYQGDKRGVEHFISEKSEDVVRAVQERIESDKPFSAGEIVRRVRTRMIDSHQLEEWYVYLKD